MALLLLFNPPAASGATGTAFESFAEMAMVKGDWELDSYLAFAVQTHDDTGAAADADAAPSYVIRNAETGASVASGNMSAVAGVDGMYTARLQLTEEAGFATGVCYTLRIAVTMATIVAAAVDVFRVGPVIDPQDLRDAMKLAPTAGAAAAGSVDDLLGDIKAVTDALDVSEVTQVAASNAGHLTITAGITFEESVTGLTIPADWVAAIWTLKANVRDADTAALVQLRETNPAAGGDGLQRVNGAAPAAPITADDGELTANQAGGSITIYLTDELSALLAAAVDLGWDVKFIDASGDSSGQRGTADVVLTETRATT